MSFSYRATSRTRLSASEQRARAKEQALHRCQRGDHQTMPTFRPGERVCLLCGVVFYCPACLSLHHLHVSHAARTFALVCPNHQKAEVQQP